MHINIYLDNLNYRYDVYQMFNIFYTFHELKFVNEADIYDYKVEIGEDFIKVSSKNDSYIEKTTKDDNFKECLKRCIFSFLTTKLKDYYPWGILVGIRPSKIALKKLNEGKTEKEIINYFESNYLATKEKAKLCIDVAKREKEFVNKDEKTISIYVGMAFCPTRCLYCSFAANPIQGRLKKEVDNYINALKVEIKAINSYVREKGLKIETVYFGGGTPTSVSNEQFEDLLKDIYNSFVKDKNLKEFTVECGRPDSITREKLETMKKYDVSRISINPQTMNDETLKSIGRNHSVKDVIDKFNLARDLGFDNINMDIIIGLPNEGISEIENTCNLIKKLRPDSLTIHGMSIKRASRLYENLVLKKSLKIENQENLNIMYDMSKSLSKDLNMEPYYMYRQKNMVGNMENVGFSVLGKESVYNIQMIEDSQTIIAIGADAVSKVVYLTEGKNRIERFANIKDVKEYISRIDDMVKGKIDLLNTLYK